MLILYPDGYTEVRPLPYMATRLKFAQTLPYTGKKLYSSPKLSILHKRSKYVQDKCDKMQPAEKDEYKTPPYGNESYGNCWGELWKLPADQNSPEDSLIGQTASPHEPTPESNIIYHSGFHEHGPSGKS